MSAVKAQVMRGLDVALAAVVEHRPSGLHLGRRVGEVVGEHLVHIGSAVGGEVPHGLADHAAGELDDIGRSGQIGVPGRGCAHGATLPMGTTDGSKRPGGELRHDVAGCSAMRLVRLLRFEHRERRRRSPRPPVSWAVAAPTGASAWCTAGAASG